MKNCCLFYDFEYNNHLRFCAPIASIAADGDTKKSTDGIYQVNTKVYADAYMLINLDDNAYPVIASKMQKRKNIPRHSLK